MTRNFKPVSEWDETPTEEKVLTCPVCGRPCLEEGTAKIHFSSAHGNPLSESSLTLEDFKRHLDKVDEQ